MAPAGVLTAPRRQLTPSPAVIDVEPVTVYRPPERDRVESTRRVDPAGNPCVARSCAAGTERVSPGDPTTWPCVAGCHHCLVGEPVVTRIAVAPHPDDEEGAFSELWPVDSAWSEVELEFAMLVICSGPCRHGASLGDFRWHVQLLKKRHGAQRRRMRRYLA